jgi:hypothetical protein
MTKYRVTLETTAAAYIEVEAEDEDSAIDAAMDKAPRLCARCTGWGTNDVTLDLAEFEPSLNPNGSLADYAVEEMES